MTMPAEDSMLVAPFTYFGGKSAVAEIVWRRIGDVQRWIEPFFGSGAVTLARPSWHRGGTEIVNDIDAYVANFWRAIIADPDAVAEYCNWPVNECDLEARHKWLVEAARKRNHTERMRDDPDYYDAKIAGWWCWGLAQWIGSGWCNGEWHGRNHPDSCGTGTHDGNCSKRPQLSHSNGVHRIFPHIGSAERGENERRLEVIYTWFRILRDRLRNVMVVCGDWKRVCSSKAVLLHDNTCGVFLDPPYSAEADREMKLYNHESGTVAHEVREWCMEWDENEKIRIALCGYEGEGHEELERRGWTVVSWKAQGGLAHLSRPEESRGISNRFRERIWFSPHCLKEESLFQ